MRCDPLIGAMKMGWSNYIIIPKLKVIVETNREVDDIEFYQKDSFDKIIDEEDVDNDIYLDLENVKIFDITIKELALLYSDHEIMRCIKGIHIDKLLLYWLKTKGIDFEIESEFNIDKEKYKSEGYIFLER